MDEVDKRSQSKSSLESMEMRFIVSSDNFSQERLTFVKKIGGNLGIFPFYRCLGLKGSLAKGKKLIEKNAADADINMPCFLDSQEILNQSIESLRELCKRYNVDDKLDNSPISVNDGKWNIFISYNLVQEILVKIRLARRVTGQFINKEGELFFRNSKAKPKIWPEVSIISEEGPFSIYSTLLEYETLPTKTDEARIAVTRALALPFGLLINGNLAPYMKTFFHTLVSLDPLVAEQKWQSIRKAIIQNERWGLVSPNIDVQIPKSVEEAKNKYLINEGPRLE